MPELDIIPLRIVSHPQDPSPIKKKGVRETLASEEGAAAARLSHRLVALQTDVDVPVVRC